MQDNLQSMQKEILSMLNNNSRTDKSHNRCRPDYIQFSLRCPLCIKIQKQSRKFKSPYALQYHLTNFHDSQDELICNLKISEVRDVVRTITKACQWRMF